MSRFLFATMPVPGHVAPLAPVARALVERGHEVMWYGSRFLSAEIERTGATFSPIRSTLDYGDADLDRHFPGRSKRRGLSQVVWDFERLFVDAVPGYVQDLRAIMAEFAPDALVVDPAVAAGAVISEVDDFPTAIVNVSVLGIPGREIAPFGMGLPPRGGPLGRLRNASLTWVNNKLIFRTVNRAYRRQAEEHGWKARPFRPEATRFLYLQPGVPSLEYERSDLPPQVHFVGALVPGPPVGFHAPDWWDQLLMAREAGLRVVAVTQGTIATDPDRLIRPALAALADLRDLFVVVAGADPHDVELPANARAAAFIPFASLMPHVDVFLTNGGFGGVMIALSAGVPVVVAGVSEDKVEVGRRVTHAEVGIHLRTDRPDSEKLRDAVRAVLDQPRFRQRAEEVRAELAAHDGPAEAADLLERLASTGQPVLREV